MEAFIDGISAISPQKTLTGTGFLQDIQEYNGVHALKCIEPPYNDFLDPMASRRMSRIVKMGVCAAMQCLHEASLENPDAIITGTGLGCIEDTEKFLTSLYTNEEKLLNPTPFIQSTHNTVAAAIALLLKCNSYNNTYVHRGFSFESALFDGLMLLHEGAADRILVGGLDELTNHSFTITNRLGFWKKQPLNSLRLLDYKSKGSLAGEGIAFFALSRGKSVKTISMIRSMELFLNPGSPAETEKRVSGFVEKAAGRMGNIDLIVLGMNGDPEMDETYHHMVNHLFGPVPCTYFKHLCGEYNTASSFALYLAASILKEQKVPEAIRLDNRSLREIKNILVYNHVRNSNHSMFVISAC
jgi:3-oxoacyl-[acyl-carrier-protein] synthase II